MSSKHETMNALLCDYLEDALSPEETQDVEAHLKECRECREELCQIRTLDELSRDLPEPELPAGFLERLSARLDEVDQIKTPPVAAVPASNGKVLAFEPRRQSQRSQHSWKRPLLAAASLVALLGGAWWGLTPRPAPSAEPLAYLAAAEGPVQIGQESVQEARPLHEGTTLATGQDRSILTVGASDNQVRVGEETRLTVQTLAPQPGQKTRATFRLDKGKVWITERSAQVAIRTDHALIIPVGTDYEVSQEGPGQVRVSVWDGQVQVRHDSGTTENLGPGQELSYGAQAPSSPAAIAPERRQEAWHDWNDRVQIGQSYPRAHARLATPFLRPRTEAGAAASNPAGSANPGTGAANPGTGNAGQPGVGPGGPSAVHSPGPGMIHGSPWSPGQTGQSNPGHLGPHAGDTNPGQIGPFNPGFNPGHTGPIANPGHQGPGFNPGQAGQAPGQQGFNPGHTGPVVNPGHHGNGFNPGHTGPIVNPGHQGPGFNPGHTGPMVNPGHQGNGFNPGQAGHAPGPQGWASHQGQGLPGVGYPVHQPHPAATGEPGQIQGPSQAQGHHNGQPGSWNPGNLQPGTIHGLQQQSNPGAWQGPYQGNRWNNGGWQPGNGQNSNPGQGQRGWHPGAGWTPNPNGSRPGGAGNGTQHGFQGQRWNWDNPGGFHPGQGHPGDSWGPQHSGGGLHTGNWEHPQQGTPQRRHNK